MKMPHPRTGRRQALVAATLALMLAGCDNGGDGDAPVDDTPPAVTQTIAPTGGRLQVPLAAGGQVEMVYAEGAFRTARSVTVTPLPAREGAWPAFTVDPPITGLRAALTMRLLPPRATDPAARPALQLGADASARWLATTVANDGALVTTIAGAAVPGTAASARPQALRARNAADDSLEPPSQVALAPFNVVCDAPADVLAAARAVFDHATSVEGVRGALALLANLRALCHGVPNADVALQEMQGIANERYALAVQAWQAVDHSASGFGVFAAGLQRVLVWCSAAQKLGLELACPATGAAEFDEMRNGLAQAIAAAADLPPLQRNVNEALQLAKMAQGLGVGGDVDSRLLALAGDAGRRIVERAWADCSLRDLQPWADELATLPGAYPATVVTEDMAYCGSSLQTRLVGADGSPQPAADHTLAAGLPDGTRPQTSTRIVTVAEGTLSLRFAGPALRCARAIGAPVGSDLVVYKVGDVEVARHAPVAGRYEGDGVTLPLADLRSRLGLAAASRDPIVIDVWRVNALLSCDDFDGALRIALPDTRLYRVTLGPATATLRVEPASATLAPLGRQDFTALAEDLPEGDIEWAAEAGVVDAAGHYTAPAAGGSFRITASSRSQPGLSATATATVAGRGTARLRIAYDSVSTLDWSAVAGVMRSWRKTSDTRNFGLDGLTAVARFEADGSTTYRFEHASNPVGADTLPFTYAFETRFDQEVYDLCGVNMAEWVVLPMHWLRAATATPTSLSTVATLRIAPDGQARWTFTASASGPGNAYLNGQFCYSDGRTPDGHVVTMRPTSSAIVNGWITTTRDFDWRQRGATSAPVVLESAWPTPGVRTTRWDGMNGVIDDTQSVDERGAVVRLGSRSERLSWSLVLE